MKNKRRLAAAFLASCVLAGCSSSCSLLPAEEELPTAPVYNFDFAGDAQTAVARGDIIETVTVSCHYNAAIEEKLSFGISGLKIARVYVQKGDTVTAGQLLAELESEDVQERIEKQEGVISDMNTAYYYLKEERELQKKKEQVQLQEIAYKVSVGAASQSQYDAKVSAIQSAQSAYENDCTYYEQLLRVERTRLAEIEEELTARRIYAGIDGVVRYIRKFDEETLSNMSANFMVVSDIASASFSASNVTEPSYFAEGDKVTIISRETPYEATVQRIEDTSVSSKNVRYNAYFQLDVPAADLQAGDSGAITLTLNERYDVLYLPSNLVYGAANSHIVYYLDDSGILKSKVVKIGLTADGKTEILSGLEEGELVVERS